MADNSTPLTPAEQAQVNQGLQAANRLLKQRIDILKVISTFDKNSATALNNDIKLRREVLNQFAAQRKAIAELHKEFPVEAQRERQRLKSLIDGTMQIEKQNAAIAKAGAAWDIVATKRSNAIELMKKEGKIAQAKFQEIKDRFKSQGPGIQNAAHAAAGGIVAAHGAANDPASMLSALGPWGEIVKIIANVIDGVRLLTAGLQTASAESGNFATSYGQAAQEATHITEQQTELMYNYGMTTEEVSNIYKDLKNTGLSALGVVPQIGSAMSGFGSAMSDLALDTMAFAKASNQTTAQVAAQMAMLVRTNGVAKTKLVDSYDKIFSAAERVAQSGMASMSEVVQATFSMSEQFKDIGMSIMGVSQVIEGVSKAMKDLKQGGGIDAITRVSEGLLGLSKAGEGWQAFMGKMSGMGGDFLGNLFQVQQRGPDMMNHAGQLDPIKNLELFQKTIAATAGKSRDPRMAMMIAEQMGQSMGLDRQTTDVLMKMSPAQLKSPKGQEELKKLQEAAKENNMSSKGMFDILRGILIGLIAKPLMYIWKHFANGGEDAAKADAALNQVNSMSAKSDLSSGINRSSGIRNSAAKGATITRDKNGHVVVNVVQNTTFQDGSTGKILKTHKKAQQHLLGN